MVDKELIGRLRKMKAEKDMTLYDLSKLLDVQVSTIDRWLKTNHINRLYARVVKEKLDLL